uniref:Chemosensory protein 5 n=1 Tax=Ectropis obliqua TaxID=248899 RepID=A0A1L2BLC4_ECTOB|nr:chemosensory protein 5 [Ectropis obliqua]
MLVLSLLSVFSVALTQCEEIYTNKYDGVDLEEILANERLLTGYVNCLLDLGPCTPDAKELKKNLPDAIENDCEKCTDRQRDGADEVMHHIINHRPQDWQKLELKYNEDGSYKRKYLASKNTAASDEEKSTDTQDKNDKEDSEEKDESE